MSLQDPFYVVKDEVFKALNKTRGLYLRWQELAAAAAPPHSPEAEWTSTELKNALRSIQWDLDDLEDTISIVEKNSSKFKIDNKEITERRKFIDNTRKEVKTMKDVVQGGSGARAAAGGAQCTATPRPWGTPDWYTTRTPPTELDVEDCMPLIARSTHSPAPMPYSTRKAHHGPLVYSDDSVLESLESSADSLRQVSGAISKELTEHQILIEDVAADMENTSLHLRGTTSLGARMLSSADKRQCWTIGVLLALVGVVVLLFFVL